jgi:aurora kinase
MHRYIKLENLLLGADGNIMLADFGVMSEFVPGIERHTISGMPDYFSPQMFHGTYDKSVDVWALGILLYEFLFDELPFGKDDQTRSIILYPPETDVSKEAKDLISKLLNSDSNRRITVDEIPKHFFMLKYPKK